MRKSSVHVGNLLLYNALLLVAVIVFLNLNEANMVIYLGVKTKESLYALFPVLMAVLFLGGNGLMLIRAAMKRKRERVGTVSEALVFSSEILSTEGIRKELEKNRRIHPVLASYVKKIREQMDSMDRKQEKIQYIIRCNQMETLRDVESALDDAEQGLCRNIVKILNRMILWDSAEYNQAGKEEIYKRHQAYIKKFIDVNEGILYQCDNLLTETVNYVNEKDAAARDGGFRLDVMTQTIQALRALNTSEQEE